MKESILQEKALNFASKIVLFHQGFSKSNKEKSLSNKLITEAEEIKRMLISSLNTAK
jgi:hypothetical protein